MYLTTALILITIDTLLLKKKLIISYTISILNVLLVMAVFTGEAVTILSIIMALWSVGIYGILEKIVNRKRKVQKMENNTVKDVRIGFYLSVSNILILLYVLLIWKI